MNTFKQTLLGILCVTSVVVHAQSDSYVREKLSSEDYVGLVNYYNTANSQIRGEIEDVFDCYVDWQVMTYEQLCDMELHCTPMVNSPLKILINRVLRQKEVLIVNETSKLTSEQICFYLATYPKREKIISDYLNTTLSQGLDSLTYDDLQYLDVTLPPISSVRQQLDQRKEEGNSKYKNNVDAYCQLEAAYTDRLLFILKYRSWQYLIARQKLAAKYYSQVGIVDDYPNAIASQYNGIIHSCFSSDDLNRQLNKDVTAFVKAVNNARERFATQAAVPSDFPKLSIKLPSIGNFPINSKMEIVRKIPAAREDFVSSRQAAGTMASIASWFVGGFTSAIGQGLFDLYAVNELAEKEFNARREYMTDVCDQLQRLFYKYFDTLENSVRKQTTNSQNNFKNYVNKL